jgi:hypothetical protein
MTKKGQKKTIEYYINRFRSKQYYCSSCQPYESGECIWVRGPRYSMQDFLEMIHIPKKHWEGIANSLNCYSCRAPLSITCDVGTQSEDELRQDRLWNRWYKNYEWRFKDFAEHLEKFPYLGLAHQLGKHIFKDIKNLPPSSINELSWFRARRVEKSNWISPEEMLPPDPERIAIPEGRYNHFGQRAFYLAGTSEGAAREVLGNPGGLAWVQEFSLYETIQIADLSKGLLDATEEGQSVLLFGLTYSNVLAHPVRQTVGWKPEYFVPRFIADCLKQVGFRGIRFRSPHHYSDNLVLFQYEDGNVKPIKDPILFTLKRKEESKFPTADFLKDLGLDVE